MMMNSNSMQNNNAMMMNNSMMNNSMMGSQYGMQISGTFIQVN